MGEFVIGFIVLVIVFAVLGLVQRRQINKTGGSGD